MREKKYGYRIMRHSVNYDSDVPINAFVGSYGFETTDEALNDALERIEHYHNFVFYVEIFSFLPDPHKPGVQPNNGLEKLVVVDWTEGQFEGHAQKNGEDVMDLIPVYYTREKQEGKIEFLNPA